MKNNRIHIRAEFIVKEGKIDEFKKLIQDMSRMVEVNEPDTIDYEFILIVMGRRVLYMKLTQIQRLHSLTQVTLHRKQYFQRFSISQR